ncbi:MAG: DUF1501 domain-containing protein [Phycisphaerales bacterium]|nr:DUF1501 domain-containing protein [Phycisphaerales bacterium]
MSPDPHLPFTRRSFIAHGATLASLAATIPAFIHRSAFGLMIPQGVTPGSAPGFAEDRILVVLQLGGGNDGLNTVVPYGMDDYYKARPQLAVPVAGEVNGAITLPGNSTVGLHPAMTQMRELLDEGRLAIVQGVGYPNPNRSHFTSMDIWHTANTDAQGDGWIGKYFDCTCNGTPVPEGAIAIGRSAPLAMSGRIQKPVAFENAQLFRWMGADDDERLAANYERITRAGVLPGSGSVGAESQSGFLMRTALDAQLASDRIRGALGKRPLVEYPQHQLAKHLQAIGSMIRDGMPTRVYYASLGGFDTHAGQQGTHANLLRQVSESLRAFQRDLDAQGNAGRVLTMVFSEFGRRVRQNASGGTDHGTAAPMFLIGPMVNAGLHGEHPSLNSLDNGDLRFGTDFRSVYASILEDWMRTPSSPILGAAFEKARILRAGA